MGKHFSIHRWIGLVMVGISFNVVLTVLGLLGFELVEALYLTITLLTIAGAIVVQHLIQHHRKDEE